MSCIVYQTNKKTGITYAYESISYWDKEKQQPRSKRKYLGRVDPETKEIIPKAEKKSDEKSLPNDSRDESKLQALLKERDQMIEMLRKEVDQLKTELATKDEAMTKIRTICEGYH